MYYLENKTDKVKVGPRKSVNNTCARDVTEIKWERDTEAKLLNLMWICQEWDVKQVQFPVWRKASTQDKLLCL